MRWVFGLAAVIGIVSGSTSAQINPFGANPQAFTDADRQRMYGSMTSVLDSQEVGATAEWVSENGAYGGKSELLEVYTQDGMRCGLLRHRFADLVADDALQPDVTRYDIRGCDVPDEGWRFAF